MNGEVFRVDFDEWVRHVFVRPADPEAPWDVQIGADFPEPPPAVALQYLRRLFCEPTVILTGYSNE